jgi:Family of unknown function (DUF6064)
VDRGGKKMSVPFTVNEFLGVFQTYNLAVWPMQIIAYLVGGAAIFLTMKKSRHADRIVAFIVSVMWLWNGCIYHLTYFSSINKAAYLFGSLFVLQALIFFWKGVIRGEFVFAVTTSVYSFAGGILLFYSLVVYPILGHMAGHGWPQSPAFGLAPCPTTIFTFGLLLLCRTRMPIYVLIIPLIWSLIGLRAAVSFGIHEDFGLITASLIGTTMMIAHNRKLKVLGGLGARA